MAGTPPNTAQSPNATKILERLRILWATSSFALLLMPPSRMPTSTPLSSGSFRSVIGVARKSASSTIFRMRSSISSRDIWQPAQPQIQSEEILGLVIRSSIQSDTGGASQDGFLPVAIKGDVHL